MNEHKGEIIKTRVGYLGGSDAKLIQNIAALGYVPQSARKRLAICKGLIEAKEGVTTNAMRFGDFIESCIYENLCGVDNPCHYESNPLFVSKKFQKKNVTLMCHPDIVLVDEEHQTINVWEVKASKFNVKVTKETYRAQMFIEWTIANELARERGKKWKTRIFLCHYDTMDVDVDDDNWTFEPERLTIHKMQFTPNYIDISAAMTVIDSFLEDFTEFYDGDEIDSTYLPVDIKREFDIVTNTLKEIKEREKQVEEFKGKLYAFMHEKGINSIKNEQWTISRIDGGETRSFDGKRYVEFLKKEYPRKSKKIIEQFTKTVNRKGYVQIKLSKNG